MQFPLIGAPFGYRPLVDARITFTGSDGVALSEALASDACGAFTASAPAGAIGVRATRTGFRPIETDVKAPGDEIATSLFSSQVYFIDQARLDERIAPVDIDGSPVAYALGEDGFVTDAARMRLVIDAYNRRSDLYGATGDPRHPDTPAGVFLGRYRFGGTTACHDAVGDTVDRLATRPTPRPVVVAMTDGRDNASALDLGGAIERARQADIPVYTVGFDAPDEADGLARLSTETGGSYFQADGDGIGTVYQSIQTGIVFQYVARLGDVDLDEGTVLGLSFDYNGLQAERSLTLVR